MDDYLYSELLHDHASIPSSEDEIVVSAFIALIIGHIFDYSQDSNPEILEHFDSLDDVDEGEALGGGDDDCAVELQLLAETQLDVAGAWGHVDHEVVQLAPVRLIEELGDD
jgi:hypothetical protein